MSENTELLERLNHYVDNIQKGVHISGTQMRTLLLDLHAAQAALEADREDVKAVGTVLGGEFHYLRPSHGLPDGTLLYAIDQTRKEENPS